MALISQKQIKLGSVGTMAKSPEVIAVLSSAIVAPFVTPHVNKVLNRIPVLRDHKTAGSFVAGFVIFLMATKVKSNVLRPIMIGVAGAFVLVAVLPFVSQITSRLK